MANIQFLFLCSSLYDKSLLLFFANKFHFEYLIYHSGRRMVILRKYLFLKRGKKRKHAKELGFFLGKRLFSSNFCNLLVLRIQERVLTLDCNLRFQARPSRMFWTNIIRRRSIAILLCVGQKQQQNQPSISERTQSSLATNNRCYCGNRGRLWLHKLRSNGTMIKVYQRNNVDGGKEDGYRRKSISRINYVRDTKEEDPTHTTSTKPLFLRKRNKHTQQKKNTHYFSSNYDQYVIIMANIK